MTASHPTTAPVLDRLVEGRTLPRTVLVCAHPDDEVIGAGTLLGRFHELALIEVTDGAPRDMADARAHGFTDWHDYAAARQAELESALTLVSAKPHPMLSLGVPDQQACSQMACLALQIASVVDRFEPEVILTHPYEGGHPDHDACAFSAWAAARLTNRRRPVVAEFACYHAADGPVKTGSFLPNGAPAKVRVLSPQERSLKRRMLDCYTTQQETIKMFYALDTECFRLAPSYCFTRPPHEGKLHYERYPWGMEGARFCQLAEQAAQEIGLRC